MPPENSCGNALARSRGSGMPTRSSSSTACSQASFLDRSRCTRRAWARSRPTLKTGVSADIGSWKTMPMSLPRTRASAASSIAARSRPPSRIRPPTRAVGGSRPRRARAVADLPEPDSPTMPRVRPGRRSKSTPRTASTGPCSEGKETRRSRTDRTGAGGAGGAWIPVRGPVSGPVGRAGAGVIVGLLPRRWWTWGRGRRAGRRRRRSSRR